MSLFDQYNWQGTRGFPYFWGYYWLGPTEPHLVPKPVGMTDTVTGTVYYLTLNPAGDHLQLTTVAPPGPVKVLPAGDFLYMGQYGAGLAVTAGHLTVTIAQGMPTGGTVVAPNALSGIATLIGGLFLTLASGAPGFDHVSVAVATIQAKTTPPELQIPPVVNYQGYYYELQDAHNTGNLI